MQGKQPAARVFYQEMKADYLPYTAEVRIDDAKSKAADSALGRKFRKVAVARPLWLLASYLPECASTSGIDMPEHAAVNNCISGAIL